CLFTEESCGSSVFAVAKQPEKANCHNDPERAEQSRNQQQGDDHQPGPITAEQFSAKAGVGASRSEESEHDHWGSNKDYNQTDWDVQRDGIIEGMPIAKEAFAGGRLQHAALRKLAAIRTSRLTVVMTQPAMITRSAAVANQSLGKMAQMIAAA